MSSDHQEKSENCKCTFKEWIQPVHGEYFTFLLEVFAVLSSLAFPTPSFCLRKYFISCCVVLDII